MKSAKTSSPMQMNYKSPAKKMDPMYNGEPGIQKEDFGQFSKSSPTKLVGVGKLAVKAFNKARKFFKGNKKIDFAKEPTYYNKKTRSYQSTKPNKIDSNPFTDPNKAKKTFISDDYKMRTDYTNEFIKKGDLKVK